MDENDGTEERLGIALLNGAVLSLIGILVLLTPLITELTAHQKRLDTIAGSVLLVCGLLLLYWHFAKGRHA